MLYVSFNESIKNEMKLLIEGMLRWTSYLNTSIETDEDFEVMEQGSLWWFSLESKRSHCFVFHVSSHL